MEDEDTPKQCLLGPSGPGSTHHQGQVALVEASEVDLAAAAAAAGDSVVVVVDSVAIASGVAEESDIKVVGMDSVDSLPPTHPQDQVEDAAADLAAEEVVDSTEGVSRAATVSQFVHETDMRTETVVTTAMVTATETVIAVTTVTEEIVTATETVIVIVSAIDLAVAGRTMGASDTVKMMAMMTPAPGDVTKSKYSKVDATSSLFPSVTNLLVGIPDLSPLHLHTFAWVRG